MHTLLTYFAVSRNANVHGRLMNLLHRTHKCTFRKENLKKKNEKLKGREFLQLFVQTLLNKLSKKDNK